MHGDEGQGDEDEDEDATTPTSTADDGQAVQQAPAQPRGVFDSLEFTDQDAVVPAFSDVPARPPRRPSATPAADPLQSPGGLNR